MNNEYPLVPIPHHQNKTKENTIALPHQFFELFNLISDIKNGEVTVKIQDGIPVWASYIRESYKFKGGDLWILKVSATF